MLFVQIQLSVRFKTSLKNHFSTILKHMHEQIHLAKEILDAIRREMLECMCPIYVSIVDNYKSLSTDFFCLLESHPTCNAICGADYVNLTCEIHFHGNWAPAMEWRQCDDNDEIVITADVEYYTYPDERVVSTLTLRHNVIDKGSCHRITAFFTENGRPIGTDADNVPSYKYTTLFNQSSEMCGK